jgi:hypothetical protein
MLTRRAWFSRVAGGALAAIMPWRMAGESVEYVTDYSTLELTKVDIFDEFSFDWKANEDGTLQYTEKHRSMK